MNIIKNILMLSASALLLSMSLLVCTTSVLVYDQKSSPVYFNISDGID